MTTLLSRTRRAMNSAEGGWRRPLFLQSGGGCLFVSRCVLHYVSCFVLSVYFCFVVCLFVCLLILICFPNLFLVITGISSSRCIFLRYPYRTTNPSIATKTCSLVHRTATQTTVRRPASIKRRLRAGSSSYAKNVQQLMLGKQQKLICYVSQIWNPKSGKESSQKVLIFCENDVR